MAVGIRKHAADAGNVDDGRLSGNP